MDLDDLGRLMARRTQGHAAGDVDLGYHAADAFCQLRPAETTIGPERDRPA
jgi:hypothetical protein